jgi:addiction module HigA family antidote
MQKTLTLLIITEEGTMPKKAARSPAIHPGEILREEYMKPLGLSVNGLARDLYVPVTRIAEIVNERRGVTADTALRLGRYFGATAEYWMSLQKLYELEIASRECGAEIAKRIQPRNAA